MRIQYHLFPNLLCFYVFNLLCYNKFYEVVPADAKENLEQFEYKSKFVPQEELVYGVPFLKFKR